MLLNDLVAKQGNLVSVSPSHTARSAAKTMARGNVGSAAVMENDQIVGIITERDMVRRVIIEHKDLDTMLVSELMTKDVIMGKAKDDLGTAANLMQTHHIRHLPVVDEQNKLLGVLSIRDLLREQNREMRDYIAQTEG